jgi:hypothetical protein
MWRSSSMLETAVRPVRGWVLHCLCWLRSSLFLCERLAPLSARHCGALFLQHLGKHQGNRCRACERQGSTTCFEQHWSVPAVHVYCWACLLGKELAYGTHVSSACPSALRPRMALRVSHSDWPGVTSLFVYMCEPAGCYPGCYNAKFDVAGRIVQRHI